MKNVFSSKPRLEHFLRPTSAVGFLMKLAIMHTSSTLPVHFFFQVVDHYEILLYVEKVRHKFLFRCGMCRDSSHKKTMFVWRNVRGGSRFTIKRTISFGNSCWGELQITFSCLGIYWTFRAMVSILVLVLESLAQELYQEWALFGSKFMEYDKQWMIITCTE